MGKHYGHFSLEERCQVAELHQAGHSVRQIATALDRSPSSISRELKRNRGVQIGYKPTYAQEQAAARRWKGSRLERNAELRGLVLDRLKRGWSPEQIAGWLARSKATTRISHETIYRFIYDQIRRTNDGSWRHYLPRAKGKRGQRRRTSRSSVSLIKGRVSIALRPPEVERRGSFGHWEADLMLFTAPGQAILVSQERKSRALLSAKQPGKAAVPAAARLLAWFTAIVPQLRKSITFDNGTEFAQHLLLVDQLGIQTFFCDPHSPWQKGTIENAIGRLRRFLPRNTNISTIDDDALNACIAAYNNTPRKCLGFQTPAEVLLAQLLHFKCESTPSLRSE
jgi:transposase, IS30 family